MILQATPLPEPAEALLRRHFEVTREPAPHIRGIAAQGHGPVTAELIGQLPSLEIIACFSAGVDGIDVAAAAARGIPVTNTSTVLADDVADTGLMLLLSAMRGFVAAERYVQARRWPDGMFPLWHSPGGQTVGILGLGHIGKAVARRCEAIGMKVIWHGPRPKPDVPWPYVENLVDLARLSRVLVVCCPGGAATRNLVDGAVLEALGATGYLVNIARGSVVHERDLIDALARGRIAGAGLDVFADEPNVPAELLGDDRVVVLPHMASGTEETRRRMGEHMVEQLVRKLKPGG